MPQDESNPIDGVDEARPLQLDVSVDDLVCFTSVSETRYAAISSSFLSICTDHDHNAI
jgi:hypothetical protein